VFSKAANYIRQAVFGSISQKELNKRAAVIYRNQNSDFVKKSLEQKRLEAVKQ